MKPQCFGILMGSILILGKLLLSISSMTVVANRADILLTATLIWIS